MHMRAWGFSALPTPYSVSFATFPEKCTLGGNWWSY